jgi:hypothetical protein
MALPYFFLRRRGESRIVSTVAVFFRRRAALMLMNRPVPESRPRWVVFLFLATIGS